VVSTPLKNISQLGLLFPIYGKRIQMFQTTNQLTSYPAWSNPHVSPCFTTFHPGEMAIGPATAHEELRAPFAAQLGLHEATGAGAVQ